MYLYLFHLVSFNLFSCKANQHSTNYMFTEEIYLSFFSYSLKNVD